MSCFETSIFLKNQQSLKIELLERACQKLGWQAKRINQDLIVHNVGMERHYGGEFLLKVSGNSITHNRYFLKNGSDYTERLRGEYNHLNVVDSKEVVIKEFSQAGYTLKKDYDFVATEEVADSFYMVGVSKLKNEEEKRIEIHFNILTDGTVVSDSNYIPEDLHQLADEAMEEIERRFGTKRREGIDIIRKQIPEKYKGKAFCDVKNKLKTKN